MQLDQDEVWVTGRVIIVTIVVPTRDPTQRLAWEVGLTFESVQLGEHGLLERLVLGGLHPRSGFDHLSEHATLQENVLPSDSVQFHLLSVAVDLIAEISDRVPLSKHSIRLNIRPPSLDHLWLMVLRLSQLIQHEMFRNVHHLSNQEILVDEAFERVSAEKVGVEVAREFCVFE